MCGSKIIQLGQLKNQEIMNVMEKDRKTINLRAQRSEPEPKLFLNRQKL